MPYKQYDIDDTSVQMVIVMKLNQLKREELPALTYEQLEEYLMQCLWEKRAPSSLNEAANQILHVSGSDIINYLSKMTVIEGAKARIEDFEDIIGG